MSRQAADLGLTRDTVTAFEPARPGLRAPRGTHYPTLATQQLRLRSFGLADISTLVAMANEHHVADTVLNFPCPLTARYARRWIDSHPTAWDLRDSLHWAISVLEDARFVGYTGLYDIDLESREAKLTFWIGAGLNRARYAAEAAEAALAFAFSELDIHRVYAFHLTRDLLARRVLNGVGMQPQASAHRSIYELCESVTARALSRKDWLGSI